MKSRIVIDSVIVSGLQKGIARVETTSDFVKMKRGKVCFKERMGLSLIALDSYRYSILFKDSFSIIKIY